MYPIFGKYTKLDVQKRVRAEVVISILKILAPPDQICFALTCKCLYNIFLEFLRVQNKFPCQLCPLGRRRPAIYRNIETERKPRTHLLRRLENGRWRYCPGCWTLHPRSSWHLPLNKTQMLLKKPFCMPYAGKVDLCPSLTASFPDLYNLIGTIKIAWLAHARSYYYEGLLERVRGTLRHECSFGEHPFADVRVITTFD